MPKENKAAFISSYPLGYSHILIKIEGVFLLLDFGKWCVNGYWQHDEVLPIQMAEEKKCTISVYSSRNTLFKNGVVNA